MTETGLLLNEEQRMLQESARALIADHAPVEQLRKLRDSQDPKGYSEELWGRMVAQGWSGIALPEALGGLDFGFSGLGLILQESGRTLCASPLLQSVGVCAPLLLYGANKKQQREFLPQIADGGACFALALEESSRHAPEQTALEARREGEGWALRGKKYFAADGHSADHLLVIGRSAAKPGSRRGLSLFLTAPDAPGVQCRRTIMIDSRNAANFEFQDAPARLLGKVGGAWPALDRALDFGRSALAAEMLGGALEAFDRTVAYLKEREQFGAKIGAFQALQHRAAHLFSELELTRSAVLAALAAGDAAMREDSEENWRAFALAAGAAKRQANDAFLASAGEAIQMHGGIGMTDELEIGFYLKRAQVASRMWGDSVFHLRRYAELSGF